VSAFIEFPDPQGSDGWKAARAGCVTGSRVADMLATVKSGEAAGRRNYRIQLAIERIKGKPQEMEFYSSDMKRGNELEPLARMRYEAHTGNIVQEHGFLRHQSLMAGYSPDGSVDDWDGFIEIKCPKSANHWDIFSSRKIPGEYLKQVTHGFWITGAKWCDFLSYDPEMPDGLDLVVIRVNRADVDLSAHESEVIKFLGEVAGMESAMRKALQNQ